MERIQLVIHDSPWKFLLPLVPVQISQQTIVAQISALQLQNQMSLTDLQEWLEPQRSYDLQMENSDQHGSVAVVTARLEQVEKSSQNDYLSLNFQPLKGLEDLEEYVNYRRRHELDRFS